MRYCPGDKSCPSLLSSLGPNLLAPRSCYYGVIFLVFQSASPFYVLLSRIHSSFILARRSVLSCSNPVISSRNRILGGEPVTPSSLTSGVESPSAQGTLLLCLS